MRTLWALRAATLLLFIVLLTKPVTVKPDPGLSRTWGILIDNSRSMLIKDPTPRLEKAKELARDVQKSDAKALFTEFGEAPKDLPIEKINALDGGGSKTNIAAALTEIFSKNDLRGSVVLTDGRQVGTGDPVSAAAVAGKPLLLVGIGNKNYFKDLSVKNIQAPPFAFKNVPSGLTANITALGFMGHTFTVKLMEGDRVLSLQKVSAISPEFETSVNFNWTPSHLGSQTLRVEVSPLEKEVTTLNNRKDVTLEVGRDKFRVLYICGKPGPEYGFLRYQFKSDPAVELITFVILRNATNQVPVREDELSLIPFPTQETLVNQMATFDLVVFEEFKFWEYGLQPALLEAIRKKVENGGSFLLMGGPGVFGAQSLYAMPGIQEMIPVQFSNDVRVADGAREFVPEVRSHPILRIEANEKQNNELWDSLPALEDVGLIPSVKPGATVVGSVSVDGKKFAVLTVWKFGKGRVGALTARTTWRWSLVPGKKEASPVLYQQFWKNMVLWLTRADEYKTVRVSVESRPVRLNEPVPIRVWVYDEYFKPLSDVDLKAQVQGPENQSQPLEFHPETAGVFQGTFVPSVLGPHSVRVWVSRGGRKYGEDVFSFRVVEGQLEEEDLSPDFSLLKELAQVSGGRFLSAEEFSPELFKEFDQEIQAKSGRKVLLWNSPWLFAVVFCLLGVEWVLRKRRGLP